MSNTTSHKKRFTVSWSGYLNAYVVLDCSRVIATNIGEGNPDGFAVIHGTDSPVRDIVQHDCDLLNAQQATNGKTQID